LAQEIDRDPVNATLYLDRGNVHYRAGELQEAELDLRRALELSPNWGLARYSLTLVFIQIHDHTRALSNAMLIQTGWERDEALVMAYDALQRRADADRLLGNILTRDAPRLPYGIAKIYAMRGDRSAALDWLDRAYRERDPILMWIKIDPTMKTLTDEPRFKALLRQMKLAE
jgi:tetratricopeptide (TPR) repeat protein